jgi:hypothetical protein
MAKCLAMLLSQSVLRLEIALGCEYLITVHAAMLSHHTQQTCHADDQPAQYAEPALTLLMCGEVTGRVAGGRLTPQPISNIHICKMASELC